jgi:hypothetical protein
MGFESRDIQESQRGFPQGDGRRRRKDQHRQIGLSAAFKITKFLKFFPSFWTLLVKTKGGSTHEETGKDHDHVARVRNGSQQRIQEDKSG